MKTIFEEYGRVIVVALVIVALIACAVFITPTVKDNFENMNQAFYDQVDDASSSSSGGTGGAGSSSEACPAGGTHNLQNGPQWSDEMINSIAASLGHTPQEVKDLIPTGAFDETYVCSQCYSIVDKLTDDCTNDNSNTVHFTSETINFCTASLDGKHHLGESHGGSPRWCECGYSEQNNSGNCNLTDRVSCECGNWLKLGEHCVACGNFYNYEGNWDYSEHEDNRLNVNLSNCNHSDIKSGYIHVENGTIYWECNNCYKLFKVV